MEAKDNLGAYTIAYSKKLKNQDLNPVSEI